MNIGKMIKRVAGKITISSPSGGGQGKRYVHIVIEDKHSSDRIVEVEMPMLAFAEGLFSLAFRPCKVSVYRPGIEHLGLQLETKRLQLVVKHGWNDRDKTVPSDKEAAPHEIDGWKADRERFNPHCHTPGRHGQSGTYTVIFRRYVKRPKKTATAADPLPTAPAPAPLYALVPAPKRKGKP